MKKDMLQRSLSKLVRIEPAMQEYSDSGPLRGALDDDWLVQQVDPNIRLLNVQLSKEITIGLDSYVNFVEDPENKRVRNTHGVLVLKTQIYHHEGDLKTHVTIAP